MTRPSSTPVDEIGVRDARNRPFYWIDDALNLKYAPTIKAAGLAIYTVLALHARRTGRCSLSLDTIAHEAGLSTREAVISGLARLEEAKLVRVDRSPGRKANEYTLLDIFEPANQRPSKPSKPASSAPTVGKADSSSPQLSVFPDSTGGFSAPTVGKTASLSLQLSEKPTQTRQQQTIEPNIEPDDDDRRATDAQSVDKSVDKSSSSSIPNFQNWEELKTHYGDDAVARAIAAARDDKKDSLRYVAGILLNWQREGTAQRRRGGRERSDPFSY